ncbi:MAG: hypothetical protein [Circular genetic element sp.]|nr:MAG: hypothetical protein [Circular genetic element sp.]
MALPLVLFGLGLYWMWYTSLSIQYEYDPTFREAVHGTGRDISKSWEDAKPLMVPNDQQDYYFGTAALVTTYLVQGALVIAGPPPAKAFGLAWISVPMGDPAAFATGVYISNKYF